MNALNHEKKIKIIAALALFFCVAACWGKETAASIAQKWCALNANVEKEREQPAREAAEMKRKIFENEMEVKYIKNQVFMKEIRDEIEKCEDASEGPSPDKK